MVFVCVTYLTAPQHLCINACSCSWCSSNQATLIIHSKQKVIKTCYNTNLRPKTMKRDYIEPKSIHSTKWSK